MMEELVEEGRWKLTPWFQADEIVPYLEEGDLIEFHRDVFQVYRLSSERDGSQIKSPFFWGGGGRQKI